MLFYSLQKYVVTTDDGVSLELPFLSTAALAEETAAPLPSVEIVVEDTDYSGIQTGAGLGLSPVQAVRIPAGSVTPEGLASCAGEAKSLGANALALDMKPESGVLSWASSSEIAESYGASGTEDISEALSALKEEGWYLIARLSVCVDGLMSERNPSAALKTLSGETFSDSLGAWLDPYGSFVREYISELISELGGMGFDEILLTNLAHPVTDEELSYSRDMTAEPDPVSAVSSLALRLRSDLGENAPRLSAQLSDETVHGDKADRTGQDTTVFYGIFDRLYCPTDEQSLEADLKAAESALESAASSAAGETAEPDGDEDSVGDISSRFVAVTDSAPQSGSWLLSE